VLLTVKGSYFDRKLLTSLDKIGALTLNYYPDFRFSYRDVDENALCAFDLVFTTKSFQMDYLRSRLGEHRVALVQHGYVQNAHIPPSTDMSPRFDCDVLYIGNHSVDKERWLAPVLESFPNLQIKILGNGWHKVRDRHLFNDEVCGKPVYGADYASAVNRAKINLAVHMGPVEPKGWYDRVSTRTFEIPACKGFMLHIDSEEVRQLYSVGEEIGVFSTANDLRRKITYFLADGAMRESMIEKAYLRCVPAYSYAERAREITRSIGEVIGKTGEYFGSFRVCKASGLGANGSAT
jgi:spore maturation protein CgeB